MSNKNDVPAHDTIHEHIEIEDLLNIMDKEKELIIKVLKKYRSLHTPLLT